ncbi:MAG: precorrin-6y C5,15-methyltransferase (decarboxylating) subunit CbiE [Clostridia bacterium]|nr:precorrin-6y C5,15-methyltransferase (decarboxylating) subunit CbiE [Clostridia bacterium]
MSNKLYVLGVGPGSKDFVVPIVSDIVRTSDLVIGGKRNLEAFETKGKETIIIGNNLEEIYLYIADNISEKKIVVLASGDPGIFSITEFLRRKLPSVEMEVIPGISSLQYLCSKVAINWDDMKIISVHGRQQPDLVDTVRDNKKTAVFTGGGYTPEDVCKQLVEKGLTDISVTVGENLSYEDERIVTGTPDEIAKLSFNSLSIMITQHSGRLENDIGEWQYSTPGIPDSMFIRGDVPMTKEEVRTVSLAKLRLSDNSIVYDIGAGTGSVSVECGLVCKKGKVYAVERNSEAAELIEKNAHKFGLANIEIIEGYAPSALNVLPKPDRVFIGGSSGNMHDILEWIYCECENVRVVVNTVTIESTYEAIEGLESKGFKDIEITNVSVSRSRPVGGKHLMQALNPVYIICAVKEV